MNARADLPGLPAATARWVKALLALAVTVPISLAPLLGTFDVPGFRGLLALFPPTLRESALPLASVAMALTAMAVQFFADDGMPVQKRRRWFIATLVAAFALLLTLAWAHSRYVVNVEVGQVDDRESIAYVLAAQRHDACPCSASDGDAQCLARLGLNPARVPTCWPERDVRSAGLLLTLLYVLMMTALGAAVGLLVTRKGTAARRRNARRPAPAAGD